MRRLILAAATREFLERGYVVTTMADVARRAGVAKAATYRFWQTKAELFVAVQIERREKFLQSIEVIDPETFSLEEGLECFLTQIASVALSEETVSLNRVIIAEALNFPEVARAYHREGWAVSIARLGDLLQWHQNRGSLRLDDPELASAMLIGMVTAEIQRTAMLGIADAPDHEMIKARVRMAVALFLRGCQTPAS